MVKVGKWIAKQRILILLIGFLLIIPSIIGMAKTRVNYDLLSYLPEHLETVKGQDILVDEYGMGAFYMVVVEDGEEREIIGKKVTFFDIHSTKAKQFGFCMQLDEDEKLTCCGDEPYNELEQKYAENSTWLLHEAFCLYGQADEFKPYEKHHSTVKDACEMASDLNVENLILYHTEDKNIEHRQELYLEEGKVYYDGNLFVPDDLDVIEL